MIFKNNNNHRLCILIILIIGFLIRLISLGDIPGNGAVHYDEAYGGYEAWSMLNFGYDSRGYPNFPVYLKTWGAGMNLLPNLAMIPFIKFLGLTPLAIRLPQAILGCISLIIFYLLVSRVSGKDVGLVSLFVLSIVPWHIMISRWGLECNFFPGFLLISIYFLVKSTERKIYLYLSMIFFGLTFYTYAAPWVVLPFLISHLYIYIMRKNILFNKKCFGIHTVICIFILLVFAIPIISLYLVNAQFVQNITLPFFSIPKIAMRYNDIDFSIHDFMNRFKAIYNMIVVNQTDFSIQNSPSRNIGIYYKFSSIFLVLGLISEILSLSCLTKNYKLRKIVYPYSRIFIIWFFYAFLLSLLFKISVQVNRINIIHIPAIYFISQGIVWCGIALKVLTNKLTNTIKFNKVQMQKLSNLFKVEKIYLIIILLIYMLFFRNFINYYFTEYSNTFSSVYFGQIKPILEKINNIPNKRKNFIIHLAPNLLSSYPIILFYTKYPTSEFIKTAKFESKLRPIQFLSEFSNYKFSSFNYYNKGDVYILNSHNDEHVEFIFKHNLKFQVYGNYILGY